MNHAYPPQTPVTPVKPHATTRLRRFWIVSFTALIGLAATACTANDTQTDQDSATVPAAKAQPPVVPTTPGSKTKEGLSVKNQNLPTRSISSAPGNQSVPTDLMTRVRDWIADDAQVKAEQAVLKRAEKATWNDGSLGCPEPNMAYSQALVDGYWLVFYVGQTEYDMRATASGKFMRCQSANKRPPIQIDDT